MLPRIALLTLILGNALLMTAIGYFAKGFFPYKSVLSGLAEPNQSDEYGGPVGAPFNKLIFMVVDALRSDFVFSNDSSFTFTQSLVRSGAAMPFTAHASAPTITMPRIKAITTGSVPSFLDVILNFAESDTSSTLATQDSWLAQFRRKGENGLTMFGDDTWLKLFPDFFKRADGTTSFFVSDFTEVDLNVTRHIAPELAKADWDGMVLHYLGLDHIGHKSGPRSPNMRPKQAEMDAIVQAAYHAMETEEHLQSAILVLAGDHGMNDAGNHGGSAPGETSPALVFISPKLQTISRGLPSPSEEQGSDFHYYSKVDQSDIAPTLGALLGFPPPLNNLGVVIANFLAFWEGIVRSDLGYWQGADWDFIDKDRSSIIAMNAMQILNVVMQTFPASFSESESRQSACSSDDEAIACKYRDHQELLQGIKQSSAVADIAAQNELLEFCRQMQTTMSKTASNYKLDELEMGIALASLGCLLIVVAIFCLGLKTDIGTAGAWLTILLYVPMAFASSYVEEEQQFWYWIGSAWIAVLGIKSFNSKSIAVSSWYMLILCQRIIQRWNQTGQKHAGESDIVNSFLSKNPSTLAVLVLGCYALVFSKLLTQNRTSMATQVLVLVACHSALSFKINFTMLDAPELIGPSLGLVFAPSRFSLVNQARIAHATALALLVQSIVKERSSDSMDLPNSSNQPHRPPTPSASTHRTSISSPVMTALTLWLLTQTRYANIPLFLLLQIQLSSLHRLRLSASSITTTTLLLQYSSFFAFGGSNAISSIDLSNAYNGVGGYNVLAVGVLTFVSNWAAPVWWVAAGVDLLRTRAPSKPGKKEEGENGATWLAHLAQLSAFTGVSLLAVMIACMALRTHLFIWTVFSPKFLYVMAWTIAQHVVVNLGLGSALWWALEK